MLNARSLPSRPMTTAVAVLLLILLAWGIWQATAPAFAAEPSDERRLLTFSGSGTARIAPDTASIAAGVSTSAASANAAQAAASRRMRALVAHMKRAGIAAADLQTTDASVYEDYEHKGRFVASQSLAIRVTDPARAGAMLGEATQGGADTVSGPSFGLEDQRAGYDEALRAAIADARAKADAAAAHMDARVQAVYSIGETNGGGMPFMEGAVTAAADAAAPVPTEQGTQQVAITVQVSFTYGR